MIHVLCPAILVLASIPPLNEIERVAVDASLDDRDYREEAFAVLVDHVKTWTHGVGDAFVRYEPDYTAMMNDPAAYRGDLCRVSGTIAQMSPLDDPFAGVSEWAVRISGGKPVLIYIIDGSVESLFEPGDAVEINARFFKRLQVKSQGGDARSYAAFIGAFPMHMAQSPKLGATVWLVILMFPAFVILFAIVRRTRKTGRQRRTSEALQSEQEQASDDLPEDPADALAELKRRASN